MRYIGFILRHTLNGTQLATQATRSSGLQDGCQYRPDIALTDLEQLKQPYSAAGGCSLPSEDVSDPSVSCFGLGARHSRPSRYEPKSCTDVALHVYIAFRQ